ncbi:hypothetical protein HK096_006585, partial [Nowakowskiella sp. JEL0078]
MLRNSVQEVAGWIGFNTQNPTSVAISPGLPGSHPSFALYYETPNVQFMPGDGQSIAGSLSTFLAHACKRNSIQNDNPASVAPAAKNMAKQAASSSVAATKKSLTAMKSAVSMILLQKRLQNLQNQPTRTENLIPEKIDEVQKEKTERGCDSGSCLDFKKIFLPKVLESIQKAQLASASTPNESETEETPFIKSEMFFLPNDSQWYVMNQLRVHAGAPERSESGIERLSHQRFIVKIDKSSDVSEQSLTALGQLMLAQAIECFYEKANNENALSPIVSKISAQTSDFYEIAQRESVAAGSILKSRFPKFWISLIKAKSLVFAAIAHFHASPQLSPDCSVSERIARLTIAHELVSASLKFASDAGRPTIDFVQKYMDIIDQALVMVETANFEKHHQSQVDGRVLGQLKRPKDMLVCCYEFSIVMGDLTRFSDLFPSVRSQSSQENFIRFFSLCSKFVDCSQNDLRTAILDID